MSSHTPTEAAADAVDLDLLLDAARTLIRVPSWNGDESPAQRVAADLMREVGLDTDVWSVDLRTVQAHPDASWEIERDEALGVVGTLPGAGHGRDLILNGHVDVVPPGVSDLWTHAPFDPVIDSGRLYGRGSLDMKAQLAAGLAAVSAVRRSGIPLEGSVRIQSVIGEEDGGLGTLAAILRGGGAHGAVVLEPTKLAVAPVQAGCVNFRVHVPGRAAHGAVRTEGVSAIDNAIAVYRALQHLEVTRNASVIGDPLFASYEVPFPISIGTVAGGDWPSSVPDHVAMEGRLGVRPDESLSEARASLEEAVQAVSAEDPFLSVTPPVVEWWGGRFLPARTSVEHPLVQALATSLAEERHGEPTRIEGVTFGADAGLLEHVAGTPAVLFGAGDIRRAHRPDEYVEIDQLEVMARSLARTIVRFCGYV